MSADRIEKEIVLKAASERVWKAVSDAAEFGLWFGVRFDGTFVEGARLTGRIAQTTVDAEIAKLQAPHEGKPFSFIVERIEAPHRICFRWHPFAIDPNVDYSAEPMTLIEFTLDDLPGGTRLRIVESGFDRIPLARRAAAFTANDGGWGMQLRLVARYLDLHPQAPT